MRTSDSNGVSHLGDERNGLGPVLSPTRCETSSKLPRSLFKTPKCRVHRNLRIPCRHLNVWKLFSSYYFSHKKATIQNIKIYVRFNNSHTLT